MEHLETPTITTQMLEDIYVGVVTELYCKKYKEYPTAQDVARLVQIAKEMGFLDRELI